MRLSATLSRNLILGDYMKYLLSLIVLIALLSACTPGTFQWPPTYDPVVAEQWPPRSERDRQVRVIDTPQPPREENRPVQRPVNPVEPPVTEDPSPDPPVASPGLPVDPPEPPTTPDPTEPLEPPEDVLEPPVVDDSDCKIINLPHPARPDRVVKCPGERARVEFPDGHPGRR